MWNKENIFQGGTGLGIPNIEITDVTHCGDDTLLAAGMFNYVKYIISHVFVCGAHF